jgi:hypothetical protein
VSELLFVAVPNGMLDPSTVRIRVLVVPRLSAGTVADFGLRDWPSILAESSFELRTRTSQGISIASTPPRYQHRARSEIWQAFFDSDAGVIDEFQAKTQPAPEVAPTYRPADTVTDSYQSAARTLARDPSLDPAAVAEPHIRPWFTPTTVSQEPERPAPPPTPAPDFHQTVAMLRQHPTVLADLGLIFELSADRGDLDVGDEDRPRFLRVGSPDPPLPVTSAWTCYDLDAGFWPASGTTPSMPALRAGMLDLTGADRIRGTAPGPAAAGPAPAWALATFDVDGAVQGLREAALRLQEAAPGAAPVVLPPLRSGGLQLVRPGRTADYASRSAAGASNAGRGTMDGAELFAEELLLGYRMDIRSGVGQWRSLNEREASYQVNRLPIGQPDTDRDAAGPAPTGTAAGEELDQPGVRADDRSWRREEGHLQAFAAVKADDGALRADEVVARWNGWSMTLPAPNLAGTTPGSFRQPGIELPFDFDFRFRAPRRRLPRLRFSTTYQLRIRVADVTGGGRSLAEITGDARATRALIYRRYDPIQPPAIMADETDVFAPGSTVDRLVIRSDLGMSVEELSATDPTLPVRDLRKLHPPTASFALIEQHGLLDDETDERSWELAKRALAPGVSDDREASGLPDPLSDGIRAFLLAAPGGLPAPIEDTTGWPVEAQWPDYTPDHKLIELAAGTDPDERISMAWNGNRLQVRLAQAEQATIELSSTVRDGFLDHLVIRDWLPTTSDSQGAKADEVNVRLGRHPMVTPMRRIEVVHAVRKPLAEPHWQLPASAVHQNPGEPHTLLTSSFLPTGLDTDSTGRLVVSAAWSDITDQGPQPRSVAEVHSTAIAKGDPAPMSFRHEFGDTRHRRVHYTLTAISRFRPYFRSDEPDAAFQRSAPQPEVTILSTAVPPEPVVLSVLPAFRWERSASGTQLIRTRHSLSLRVELARPWFVTGEGEQLAVILAEAGTDPATTAPVSRSGRDPIFATPTIPGLPTPGWFPPGTPAEHLSVGVPASPIQVLGFTPAEAADRWFADIRIAPPPALASYAPFVQLALARYQPHSLPGLELSTIVTTDKIKLWPDRTLVVDREGAAVRVRLEGIQPTPPNRFDVLVEHCPSAGGIPPADVDLIAVSADVPTQLPAWHPVPGALISVPAGTTTPPIPLPTDLGAIRLRCREIERLESIPDVGTPPGELRERTVFLEIVDLP